MKAIVQERYGPPESLSLQEIETPRPAAGEVLVRVRAASANAGDWHLMRADPWFIRFMSGLWKPKHRVLGSDVAGVVVALGPGVTRYKPGDEVFGELSSCGFGAFAEYVCVPEQVLAPKPPRISFDEAAAVPVAGLTALQALRDKGHIQAGKTVLVHGASGGVGSFAVQIAKSFGADVTAVCSTRNLSLVRSIGADRVVDYTKEDVTRNGRTFDLILDTAAYRSVRAYQRVLRPHGIYVMVGGSTARMFQLLLAGRWLERLGHGKLEFFLMKSNANDLELLHSLVENGTLSPVIDRRYALQHTADAIRYLEAGRARGKVVIRMN